MPELTMVFDDIEIASAVGKVAQQISSDYRGGGLVLIGVLKGAFVFMADLARALKIKNIQIDFVRLASYGAECESSGKIEMVSNLKADIAGKDVLIVEDILDTGLTLAFLKKYLVDFKPRSIKTCVLIDKVERRTVDVTADYACFQAERGFLVGYGLDHAEAYRDLPAIYDLQLKED